jgi:4-hydroxybenzoate polyprenyltransferase
MLFLFQSQKGTYSLELTGLAVLAVALILAGSTALNDYFDFEADAIAWPEKPIPSKLLSG